jgi:DNA helicase-2/ATP-dependent DNA helicase PcrA
MPSIAEEQIGKRIRERHGDDQSQLDVIFSPGDRILVEAPAGYGKTSTMVSKIAYMIATQRIPYPKRLLALTFSVNAAYKIKKDVGARVPELLRYAGLDTDVRDKVIVSNYHGFSRSVLKKYGYTYHPSLLDIDNLLSIDDSDAEATMKLVKDLAYEDSMLMSNYSEAVKNVNTRFLADNFAKYNEIVIANLLPRRVIPYNAILTLARKLLSDNPGILAFYHKYLAAILVDEYQDTNTLAYKLLSLLITDRSKVILLGDALQRIYGFIGAVPGLLSISEKKFNLEKFPLLMNHRFAANTEMLRLDSNIRRNAEQPSNPVIEAEARIELEVADDQAAEASKVAETAKSLVETNPGLKVAVLLRGRGPNADTIIEVFQEKNIPYFFGLFTDDDRDYVGFHQDCKSECANLIRDRRSVTRSVGALHIQRIKRICEQKPSHLTNALLSLLEIFWEKVFTDFSFMSNEEKVQLIQDTFEYNSLRQYIEFVKANITISTVHAAKGLEWDFVLIPDMEQNQFPSYYGLCSKCPGMSDCTLKINSETERLFLEELSVFYVAVTRARKEVRFSASRYRLDRSGNLRPCGLSCFLRLPGIARVRPHND